MRARSTCNRYYLSDVYNIFHTIKGIIWQPSPFLSIAVTPEPAHLNVIVSGLQAGLQSLGMKGSMLIVGHTSTRQRSQTPAQCTISALQVLYLSVSDG